MISLNNATAKPDRTVTKFLHHIAGLEAEFGEYLSSYEYGWTAAEFGLPKSFCCSLSEQNGWLDYLQISRPLTFRPRGFGPYPKHQASNKGE